MQYHATLQFTSDDEFGFTFEAEGIEEAKKVVDVNFPECTCVQIEDTHTTMSREKMIYERLLSAMDYDQEITDFEDYLNSNNIY